VSTAVNSLPAGEVFFQSPAAGGEVALGGAVRLTVSKGPG
jgi:beta-lactam-binding protein with PASTA domain